MKRLVSFVLSFLVSVFGMSASAQGIITTVAGGGNGGDGVIATQAALDQVNDVVVDTNGNMYIAEETAIRKVDANTQIISLYAGSYQPGIGCDSCAATTAKLSHASAIAFDKQGNLYIADWGSGRIRKVDAVTGIMTTYAGNGTIGYSGDNGPAKSAQLRKPMDIAFDVVDNLYIADEFYVIRRVDRQSGIITTIAGNGTQGTWNNGDTASKKRLGRVRGVTVDNVGNIYFADIDNSMIGKINLLGILSSYCGNGTPGNTGEGGLAINAQIAAATKIRLDKNDDIVFTDFNVVKKVDFSSGILTRIAGNGSNGLSGDGGTPLNAELNFPKSICFDTAGDLFIADTYNYRIRKAVGLTDVKEVDAIEFGVYPNPSVGIINLKSSEKIRRLEIRNILGQKIYLINVNSDSVQIDIATQPDGVYIVTVYGSESLASKKIILHH